MAKIAKVRVPNFWNQAVEIRPADDFIILIIAENESFRFSRKSLLRLARNNSPTQNHPKLRISKQKIKFQTWRKKKISMDSWWAVRRSSPSSATLLMPTKPKFNLAKQPFIILLQSLH